MKIQCFPFKPSGKIILPPSKSYTHRALIAAALADGVSSISPYYPSDDTQATCEAITALGASYKLLGNTIQVTGGSFSTSHQVIHCKESGSTLRFFIPILAALGIPASYDGAGKLPSRPIEPYFTAMQSNGASFSAFSLPFTVLGQLQPGDYPIAGNISSQFITGLLFALPLLSGDSTITLLEPLESEPYVRMTIHLLSQFGIIIHKTKTGFLIPGNQTYLPCHYSIEGDVSLASALAVLGCRGPHPITLSGLSPTSVQGDQVFFSLLNNCGASIKWNQNHLVISPGKQLSPFRFDITQCPDLAPAVALLGCICKGHSIISGCGRLKLKESNRLHTITNALTAIGGKLKVTEDSISITGINCFLGGNTDSFGDHRIAMMLSVATAFSAHPITISGAQAVQKSYPTFYQDYHRLGGISHVIDL